MPDTGLTHVALPARDLDASIDFYDRYAAMRVVHRRAEPGQEVSEVAWLSDLTRPFVVVLLRMEHGDEGLRGLAHLGVACATRAELDERVDAARRAGVRAIGPEDAAPPLGYWAILVDPDGHNLELSVGQDVADTVARAARG